jgi:flagella basal body P-ring formation protein FlgA
MTTRWFIAVVLACGWFGAHAESMPSWVQTAQDQLQQRLRAAYPNVTSWSLSPMLSERQLSTATDAEVSIDAIKLGRRSALQVSWRDGERRMRQAVWFDVSGERAALRLDADVKRNEALRTEIVRADERAPWEPACNVALPSTTVQGMRARKALRAGDVICAEDIEPKPPVSRGERVIVHSSAGLVTVVVSGIAEQDGNIGDRLQVRNPENGELYVASVAAEGEVVVRQ